jgi:two-component system nitrate/nitrite sensor histidine kinase NarX
MKNLDHGFKKLDRLQQHTLYVRLMVLLLCISMGIMLIMAGVLFVVDYIPVNQSVSKKIENKRLLLKLAVEKSKYLEFGDDKNIVDDMSLQLMGSEDEYLEWLYRQENVVLSDAVLQLAQAQEAFSQAHLNRASVAELGALAEQVVIAYDTLLDALAHDLEVKQSVISLLQLVSMILIISCIIAIALEGRRVLVDRVERLLSFLPDNLIQINPKTREDEFSLLEQKLFSVMTRLEGFLAGKTWADQTSDRLRRMLRSQEYLLNFVETATHEFLSEITLRKLLYSLERALNVNNAALLFDEGNSQTSSKRVVFSHHMPAPLSDEVVNELLQSGQSSFLELGLDRIEVRCFALMFSSAVDAMDVLLIETDRDRLLEDHEIQLLELTAKLLVMVIDCQGRDQEGRRIALLEERAAIARELHDSLAQSLSFMKIQIARLQSSAGNSSSDSVITELRTGLDNAYRELRELLATFRVHMDVRGLGYAIQSAIDEFSQRSSLSITLDNRLVNCRLTVNEEFHILHVVREALSNIVRHSGASNVSVALVYQPNGNVIITVDDDGIGYKPNNDGQDHYGQAIMKERAYSLGGDIEITPKRTGGTRVRLIFTPKLPQA